MTLINSKTSDFNYLIDFNCSNIFKISNTSISGSYLLFKNALEIDSLTMDVFYFSKCIPIQFIFRFTRGVGKRGPFLESFYTKIIFFGFNLDSNLDLVGCRIQFLDSMELKYL